MKGRNSSSKRAAMLLFKKKYLAAIRAGTKTQTIRLWPYRRMRSGQRSYIPGVGYIRVESVEEIQLDDLTEADAVADGFDSLADLLVELQSLYVEEIEQEYKVFRLRFTLLEETNAKSDTSEHKTEA